MIFRKHIKQSEQGRSIVEILGVLAIIGVLSFGGIQGYKYAMDKHRANDIVNEVNMRATDIWHLYQDGEKELPDSPDEDAFPEYGEMTQTGFEIMVTSYPPIAFKTWVNDVPSAVCQKVLQENLDDAIKGLKFVQVGDVDSENLTRYTGDIAICGESGTMNQMVFTSFLSEGGGAVGGIVDPDNPNGPALEPCVDTKDCPQECGGAVCDPATMTCRDACIGTDKPFCMRASGICVECQVNEDCKHKGRGWICDESNYTCTQLQKTCPEGTFRSQNGACIPCNSGHNYVVLKGELFPDTEDTIDGYTMCQECSSSNAGENQYNRSFGDLEEGLAYCDYMCREGVTYQTKNGCASCKDTTPRGIPNEDQAKAQCLACSENHAWYASKDSGYVCRLKMDECAESEFMSLSWGTYACKSCSEGRDSSFQIAGDSYSSTHSNYTQFLIDKCNNCPSDSPRYVIDGGYNHFYCYPTCDQPENEEESIAICQANPFDENCKRKWQNSRGTCFDCDDMTTDNSMSWGERHTKLSKLCRACGRTVQGEYCVLKQNCDIGQFRGSDGFCYDCKESKGIAITSLEDSGCVSNCKKISSDATDYSISGTIETRWSYKKNSGELECAPVCSENYAIGGLYGGSCRSCGNNQSTSAWDIHKSTASDCEDCPNRKVYDVGNFYCAPKICPEDGTKKYYRDRYGACVLCSRDNSGDDDVLSGNDGLAEGVEACHACGNRMMVPGRDDQKYCYKVDISNDKTPISGICNNVENDNYARANLDPDVKTKADYFVNGDYLTQDTKRYFRDIYGFCRSCDTNTTYDATPAQCSSCKNRRWAKSVSWHSKHGLCLKGLCDNGFYLSNSSCIACSNVNKPVDPSSENLCDSCENRRVMTTGFEEQGNLVGLCVEDCPSGMWQDKDGKCYFCEEAGTKEIGTDEVSKNMCQTVCGRTIEVIKNADSEITGYKCALSS